MLLRFGSLPSPRKHVSYENIKNRSWSSSISGSFCVSIIYSFMCFPPKFFVILTAILQSPVRRQYGMLLKANNEYTYRVGSKQTA